LLKKYNFFSLLKWGTPLWKTPEIAGKPGFLGIPGKFSSLNGAICHVCLKVSFLMFVALNGTYYFMYFMYLLDCIDCSAVSI
jgi:hypothetical protein